MKSHFISDSDFSKFVESLIQAGRVVAPIAKKTKFSFENLESANDLRLDYDVTILPPKKAIMPVKQEIVRFNGNSIESAICAKPQVLLGVHFYDVKAIDMLDELFTQGHKDYNWLAYREQTTIVASSVQKVSDRAFFASVGQGVQAKGHDAFITKVNGGYVFEVVTPKGEALLKKGLFAEASTAQVLEAKAANEKVLKECPETLKHSTEAVQKKVREAFKNEDMWKKFSDQCFSCGACNIVCPTCYCFDVQDEWNLDGTSGKRCRSWDGCMLGEFAQVSLGGGHTENFREERHTRFRHRIMRKATYLNSKLGGPACVGCGRCSTSCVPDIADPVKIINPLVEA